MQQYLNINIQLLLVDIDTWSNPFVASRVFWTCFNLKITLSINPTVYPGLNTPIVNNFCLSPSVELDPQVV